MISTEKITVVTTGADGSGLGEQVSAHPVNGELVAIYVDWGSTAPGTSKIVVICESDDDHPAITLYDKTAAATDLWVYPTIVQTTTDGTARTAYAPIPVAGTLKVNVTLCNALSPAATAYVYVKS